MFHAQIGYRQVLLLVALCIAGGAHICAAQTSTPSQERRKELLHLLRNDCGACHGLHLTGGLGPALQPDALRDKPREVLVQVILNGRPGTAMPGWKPFMSESEANWLAESLLQGLNDEN